MEANFEQTAKVMKVIHAIGVIRHKSDRCLLVETERYTLILTETTVNLVWHIRRPDHDHDDRPHLVLKLPEKLVEGGETPQLGFYLKGRSPRILNHETFVYEINLYTGERKECEWVDGGWKVKEDTT